MTDRADTATHEAVHACVALELGRRVRCARVGVRPIEGRTDLFQTGAVSLDRSDVELDRRDVMIALSAGMHESNGIAWDAGAGEHGLWPPAWPVLDGAGDRGQVFLLVGLLGFTEADYDDLIADTAALLRVPAMQSWISRVAAALGRTGYLTGEEIEARRPSTPMKGQEHAHAA